MSHLRAAPLLRNALIAAVIGLVTVSAGAQGIGWRTDGTGMYPDAEAIVNWSVSENIAWATKLPEWSNATAVVVGDVVIVTAEPHSLIAVARDDGQVLWSYAHSQLKYLEADERVEAERLLADLEKSTAEQRRLSIELTDLTRELRAATAANLPDSGEEPAAADEPADTVADLEAKIEKVKQQRKAVQARIGEAAQYEMPSTHGVGGYTSATPVSDGEAVYAIFGHGVLVCYELDGTLRWDKQLPLHTNPNGFSASPLIADGKLIVAYGPVRAFDPQTGKQLWQSDVECTFGSPVLARVDGTDLIVTTTGAIIRASDGTTMASGLNRLRSVSPLVHDGVVYLIGRKAIAYRLPESIAEPFEVKQLWRARIESGEYFASPVVYDDVLYTISARGTLSAVDIASGDVLYEHRLDLPGDGMSDQVYSSITLAGDRLYVSGTGGQTRVVKPGTAYGEVAVNQLEPFRSSFVLADGAAYLRGHGHLFRIEPGRQPEVAVKPFDMSEYREPVARRRTLRERAAALSPTRIALAAAVTVLLLGVVARSFVRSRARRAADAKKPSDADTADRDA